MQHTEQEHRWVCNIKDFLDSGITSWYSDRGWHFSLRMGEPGGPDDSSSLHAHPCSLLSARGEIITSKWSIKFFSSFVLTSPLRPIVLSLFLLQHMINLFTHNYTQNKA